MAHSNYYLDLTVDTYIVNGDAVLLRFHDKYSYWGGPGGHIDPGEDANEAAIREVKEEVGLDVRLVGPKGWVKMDTDTNRDLVPPVFVNRHKINDIHDHTAFVFIAQSDSREINPETEDEKEKSAACRWFTKVELDALQVSDTPLRPEIYRYAVTALALASA